MSGGSAAIPRAGSAISVTSRPGSSARCALGRDTGVALVLTGLDTAAMSLFLTELSQAVAPGAHAVVLMDKAGWHIAGDLVVPPNLSLVFLPPYSPELNPIERLWLYLRDNRLTHRVFAYRRDYRQLLRCVERAARRNRPHPLVVLLSLAPTGR